ncbi:pentapeptide repeat-containing protein [Fundidesulfovibrio agrisoli]|uniref:pentapeptide repeat-containing protein n=1 Tax=Fundidesulfovibrio agrisoli TaxID=2922717 RepID=UPI001FAD2EB3|nr:pentapeptide repeat-containing protein [Fundidesulfovibrio agrisoli]
MKKSIKHQSAKGIRAQEWCSFPRKMIGFLFNYSGIKAIWWMVSPPKSDQSNEKPSTFALWAVGVYTAVFTLAMTRHDSAAKILETRLSTVSSQISNKETRQVALQRLIEIQKSTCPIKPDYFNPLTILLSLAGDEAKNKSIIQSTKELITIYKLDLHDIDLSGLDVDGVKGLDHANFTGSDLSFSNFSNTIVNNSNFSGADLRGANFYNSTCRDSNFINACMIGTSFTHSNLERCTFNNISKQSCPKNNIFVKGYAIDNSIPGNDETKIKHSGSLGEITYPSIVDKIKNTLGMETTRIFRMKDKFASKLYYTQHENVELYFDHCELDGTSFTNSDLAGSFFIYCNLINTLIQPNQLLSVNSLYGSKLNDAQLRILSARNELINDTPKPRRKIRMIISDGNYSK